jgi:hypothetical protein
MEVISYNVKSYNMPSYIIYSCERSLWVFNIFFQPSRLVVSQSPASKDVNTEPPLEVTYQQ